MICDKCGTKNPADARFCSKCGSEIARQTARSCGSCGSVNDSNAKFCSNCGAELSGAVAEHAWAYATKTQERQQTRKHKGRYAPPNRTRRYVTAAICVMGVLVLALLISQRSKRESTNEGQVAVVETTLRDPVDESKAMQIARTFNCSCGTCGDLSLDTCTCPTAAKEREFIRKSVREGMRSNDIVAAVNKTYGHMKSKTNFTVPPLSSFGGRVGTDPEKGN